MQFINLKKQYKRLESDIDKRIKAVLEHGQFIMGPEIDELEKRLSKFSDSKYCLSCSSGTDALLISLLAQGISSGDKIITTPFTYIATAEVIKLIGATPVFVDIDSKTFNIDYKKIDIAINDLKSVKGIIPVNLFGLPADFDAIDDVVSYYDNIFIIEDAAQSFGAIYKGRKSCSLGDIGATSFFPAKPLGCYGDGGAIFTNDDTLAEKIRMIVNHGEKIKYHHEIIGCNSRLDSIQAEILNIKLKYLDEYNANRNIMAKNYNLAFAEIDELLTPKVIDNSEHVFHQYTLRVLNGKRDNFKTYLSDLGIPSMIYYPIPIHKQKPYKNDQILENTDILSDEVISLPIHTEIESSNQDYIIDKITKYFK